MNRPLFRHRYRTKLVRSHVHWIGLLLVSGLALSAPDVAGRAAHAEAGGTARQTPLAATAVTHTFNTFAGVIAIGSVDGTDAAARFYRPYAIAVDRRDDTVYVADTGNHTIRKITPAGVVTTFAGLAGSPGAADGTGSQARFFGPAGIAVDASGTVYVADTANATVRTITPTGVVSTLATRFSTDGTFTTQFYMPRGLAVDSGGTVYVADTNGYRIQTVTPTGVVRTLAGTGSSGSQDGSATTATFSSPYGVAVGSGGVLYVADNKTVRQIASDGTVTTVAGLAGTNGGADGTGSAARFADLTAVTVSGSTVYVADGNRVRSITAAGVVNSVAGSFVDEGGWANGTGTNARLYAPHGVAADSQGNLFVADSENHSIRKVSQAGVVTTVAGPGGSIGAVDGTGSAARFYGLRGLAVDTAGVVYVGDFGNNLIRRITPAGVVTTMAGGAGLAGSTDGTGSAARFDRPAGVAVDSGGTLFVADFQNHTIRKITPAGVVSTLAGTPAVRGTADGTGSQARFTFPAGVAVDANGIVYVADSGNAAIRKITSAGVVTTFAGVVGSPGTSDGQGASARFMSPANIAVDSTGTVYVADYVAAVNYFPVADDKCRIRRITATGVVSTLAEISRVASTDLAQTFAPPAIAVDANGLVLVADPLSHVVWQVSQTGTVTALAGLAGTRGGADGSATTARFNTPMGIAVDTAGTVYVADTGNTTIRQAVPGTPTAPAVSTHPLSQTVGVGQSAQFTMAASGVPALLSYQWQLSTNGGATWTNLANVAPYSGVTTARLTVTNATAGLNAYQYRAVASNTAGSASSNTATLSVNAVLATPARLQFGATKSGASLVTVTPAQTVFVAFSGAASRWTASANQPWVQLTGAAGAVAGQFSVSIINPGDVIGTSTSLSAAITLTPTLAGLTPVTVPVTLTVQAPLASVAPFGAFDTPASGVTVAGSIPVTGWALDDVGVSRVEIWRDKAAGETTPAYPGPGPGNGKIFIANAFFIDGARPDVEALYPGSPFASRGGWGYLMLTQGLWNQGNGPFTLYAFAYDQDGHSATLGTKTITVDNARATKPFGALDTPAYGQTATTSFWNFGWALTPNATPSCMIGPSGVQVAIDSGALKPVSFGEPRTDIAGAFPGLTNSNGAGGAYFIDTTTLSNGTHQIGWYVVDGCGRAEGIGGRFFTVLNGAETVPGDGTPSRAPASADSGVTPEPVAVRRGDDVTLIYPNRSGTRVVPIGQSERVEVHLPSADGVTYAGAQVVNGERKPLPIGSSLDAVTGTFFWHPAAGFLGAFDLEFVASTGGAVRVRAVVGTSVQAVIDTPQPGDVSSSFVVAGWAIDEAARQGTGIDTVHVWAYPASGGAPRFLGVAAYGDARADIGAAFGDQFTHASYSVAVNQLEPGSYAIVVYPHSAVTGDFHGARVVHVVVP